jgi:soluble lytic murein transglycosylase-like protein
MMITTSGQVDPNSQVVQTLGLKPPTGSGPDRGLLSITTRDRMAQRIASDAQRSRAGAVQSSPEGANDWSDIAWKLSQEEGADPILVQAVMGQESGGDPNTPDSYAGARGPMQLMGPAAAEVGVNRDDPVDNTRGGIRYLKKMLDRYNGDINLALAAYNAGPGAVDQYGGVPPFEETQRYVRDVKARYAALQDSYARER